VYAAFKILYISDLLTDLFRHKAKIIQSYEKGKI